MKKGILIVLLLVIPLVSSLGISPSKHYIDFQPGLELEYAFKVYAASNQKLEVFAAGEFPESVEFDKKEIMGGDGFKAKIKLPNNIDKPGRHTIIVGVREKKVEEGRGYELITTVAQRARRAKRSGVACRPQGGAKALLFFVFS